MEIIIGVVLLILAVVVLKKPLFRLAAGGVGAVLLLGPLLSLVQLVITAAVVVGLLAAIGFGAKLLLSNPERKRRLIKAARRQLNK